MVRCFLEKPYFLRKKSFEQDRAATITSNIESKTVKFSEKMTAEKKKKSRRLFQATIDQSKKAIPTKIKARIS